MKFWVSRDFDGGVVLRLRLILCLFLGKKNGVGCWDLQRRETKWSGLWDVGTGGGNFRSGEEKRRTA
jgi:hypothetical protein